MSAAALTVTAVGGMVLGCLAVGALGQLATARAALDSSADLAVLAVAAHVVRGEPTSTACASGESVSRADGHRLLSCAVDGHVVDVVVARRVALLGLSVDLEAAARAGPVDG